MSIKEVKYPKTDIFMYDIRAFEKYEKFHFWNSQYYDINKWDDTFSEDFTKITKFKHVYIIGDESLYSSKDFDKFIQSFSQAKLKWNGLYFYNFNLKTIKKENLDELLVSDQQKTKLIYYPSLVVESEQNTLGGVFLSNERIEHEQLDKLSISDALFIGSTEQYSQMKKKIKRISSNYSNQEVTENTLQIWEAVWKKMKKAMSGKDNFLIISSDPDNLGVLLAIYYLMSERGYSYHEASKYAIAQRFKISLTQDFENFLKYLFVKQNQRPENIAPKEI